MALACISVVKSSSWRNNNREGDLWRAWPLRCAAHAPPAAARPSAAAATTTTKTTTAKWRKKESVARYFDGNRVDPFSKNRRLLNYGKVESRYLTHTLSNGENCVDSGTLLYFDNFQSWIFFRRPHSLTLSDVGFYSFLEKKIAKKMLRNF